MYTPVYQTPNQEIEHFYNHRSNILVIFFLRYPCEINEISAKCFCFHKYITNNNKTPTLLEPLRMIIMVADKKLVDL